MAVHVPCKHLLYNAASVLLQSVLPIRVLRDGQAGMARPTHSWRVLGPSDALIHDRAMRVQLRGSIVGKDTERWCTFTGPACVSVDC
jgi:hypothetical protein